MVQPLRLPLHAGLSQFPDGAVQHAGQQRHAAPRGRQRRAPLWRWQVRFRNRGTMDQARVAWRCGCSVCRLFASALLFSWGQGPAGWSARSHCDAPLTPPPPGPLSLPPAGICVAGPRSLGPGPRMTASRAYPTAATVAVSLTPAAGRALSHPSMPWQRQQTSWRRRLGWAAPRPPMMAAQLRCCPQSFGGCSSGIRRQGCQRPT